MAKHIIPLWSGESDTFNLEINFTKSNCSLANHNPQIKWNLEPFLSTSWVLSESKDSLDFYSSDVCRYDRHVIKLLLFYHCSISIYMCVFLVRKHYCDLSSKSFMFWNLYSLTKYCRYFINVSVSVFPFQRNRS